MRCFVGWYVGLVSVVLATPNGNELQLLIDGAIASRASYLRVPAGEYPTWGPQGILVSISGARDLVIDARGA